MDEHRELLQGSAAMSHCTPHTSTADRERASDTPEICHKKHSFLENCSVRKEKSPASVRLEEGLQTLKMGKRKAVCKSTFAAQC